MKNRMELVTGGSGSGKSAYAESVICRRKNSDQSSPLYYIADMMPYGKETEEKIARHRAMRAGKGFQTLEWYMDLPGKVDHGNICLKGAFVLLECVSNLTANEMYEPAGAGSGTVEAVVKGVRMLKERCSGLVVVTNDVFGDTGQDSDEMKRYKMYLAEINRKLAKMADCVTEVVSGIPVHIKTETEKRERKRKGDSMEQGIRLVTGGAYQGKGEYAEHLYPGIEWADGAECSLSDAADFRGIKSFHLFVKRWLLDGGTKEQLLEVLLKKNRNIVAVCDEVGCGLVPVDAFEREYRESVGRICTELAAEAVRVDRVVCGIGTRIR